MLILIFFFFLNMYLTYIIYQIKIQKYVFHNQDQSQYLLSFKIEYIQHFIFGRLILSIRVQ